MSLVKTKVIDLILLFKTKAKAEKYDKLKKTNPKYPSTKGHQTQPNFRKAKWKHS